MSCNSFHIYCICKFSNCVSYCTYFHIHCNRLAILSFSDFEILRCPASLSKLIAINLLSYHFLILKLCVVLQFVPHLLHLTWHLIIWEFSNCAFSCISFHINCNQLAIVSFDCKIVCLPAPLSSFSAIDLPSDHSCIFKLCVFLHVFQNHCNWLVIQKFVNFQIVHCPTSLSTFIAIDLSSDHLWI